MLEKATDLNTLSPASVQWEQASNVIWPHSPHSRTVNIITDVEFQSANNVFRGDLKRNKRKGNDKTSSYPPISEGDLEKLHESEVINVDNPDGLLKFVWFNIQVKFCRRGREGQRSIKKADWEFHTDDVGREYVCLKYLDHQKNHPGDSGDTEEKPVMYGTDGPHCPLAAMKKYLSKLNPKCEAFFQRPKKTIKNDNIWYDNMPLGVNTLGNLMKSMSTEAKLSRTYTNHSLRSTVLHVLNKSEKYSDRVICSLSGHKNPSSLRSYCKPSDGQRRSMSDTLQGVLGKNQKKNAKSATGTSTTTGPQSSCPPATATATLSDIRSGHETPLYFGYQPIRSATVYRDIAASASNLQPQPRPPSQPQIQPQPRLQLMPRPQPQLQLMPRPQAQAQPQLQLMPQPQAQLQQLSQPQQQPQSQQVPQQQHGSMTGTSDQLSTNSSNPYQLPQLGHQQASVPSFFNCNMANASFNIYFGGKYFLSPRSLLKVHSDWWMYCIFEIWWIFKKVIWWKTYTVAMVAYVILIWEMESVNPKFSKYYILNGKFT